MLPRALSRSGYAWLWGLGPGQYTSFVGMNREAPAYVAERRTTSESATQYTYPDMQWTSLIGEYGLGGLAGVALLVGGVLAGGARRRRAGPVTGVVTPWEEGLVLAVPGLVLVLVLGMTSMNFMEYWPLAVHCGAAWVRDWRCAQA